MVKNNTNFIWEETNDLHDNTTELYEALMDKEIEVASKLIDLMRSKLLTLKNDINK